MDDCVCVCVCGVCVCGVCVCVYACIGQRDLTEMILSYHRSPGLAT